jgi:hypothetical protein
MKTTLKEALYGNLATVYHRGKTADKKVLDVYTGKARNGVAIFGGGLYTTYEIESQMTPRMIKNYGEFVFKLATKIDGFFIFDKKQRASMKRLYTQKQLKATQKIEELVAEDDDFNEWKDDGMLIYVINKHKEVEDIIRTEFNGMIYTSKDDGKCALVFDPAKNFIKLLSVAQVPDSKTDPKNIEWKRI